MLMVEEYKMLTVGTWLFLSELFLLTGFINDWIQMDFYLSFHPVISLGYHERNHKLKTYMVTRGESCVLLYWLKIYIIVWTVYMWESYSSISEITYLPVIVAGLVLGCNVIFFPFSKQLSSKKHKQLIF